MFLGGMMVLGILLVLYFSLQKEIKKNEILFYLLSFPVFYLALLVSFSRAAWLGFVASSLFYFILRLASWSFQKKLSRFCLFLMLGISLAFIVPILNLFLIRTQVNNRLEIKSVDERELYLQQAKQVISHGNYRCWCWWLYNGS